MATLPPLPAEHQNPWYADREAFDQAVKAEVEVRLSDANLDARFVQKGLVDAKGDLLVASAADTLDRLPVGTDGQVLTADAASPLGVKYANPSGGGGGGGVSNSPVPLLPISVNVSGYVGTPASATVRGGAGAWGNSKRYAYPFAFTGNMSADRLLVNFTSGSAGNFRLALYADDGQGSRPGALIQEFPLFDSTPSATVEVTIAQAFVAGTIYWLAWGANSTAQTWGLIPTEHPRVSRGAWNESVNPQGYRALVEVGGGASSAFPATWPGDSVNSGDNWIAVGWRRSA